MASRIDDWKLNLIQYSLFVFLFTSHKSYIFLQFIRLQREYIVCKSCFRAIWMNRTRLRLQDKRCCFWLNAQPPQESVVFYISNAFKIYTLHIYISRLLLCKTHQSIWAVTNWLILSHMRIPRSSIECQTLIDFRSEQLTLHTK